MRWLGCLTLLFDEELFDPIAQVPTLTMGATVGLKLLFMAEWLSQYFARKYQRLNLRFKSLFGLAAKARLFSACGDWSHKNSPMRS